MPRAILFDAVGTLLYPAPPVAYAYARIGREFGSELDHEEVARRFPLAMKSVSAQRRAMLADPLATSEEQEWDRWRAIVTGIFDDVRHASGGLFFALWDHFAKSDHWALYDDVAETLAQLAAAGHRLGIASNFDGRLPPICRAFRPLRGIEVFVSSQVGFMKPDRRFFRAIEERFQLPPQEILLVGDDWRSDVEGARGAGWEAIHLARESVAEPDSAVAEGIQSLAQLPGRRGL